MLVHCKIKLRGVPLKNTNSALRDQTTIPSGYVVHPLEVNENVGAFCKRPMEVRELRQVNGHFVSVASIDYGIRALVPFNTGVWWLHFKRDYLFMVEVLHLRTRATPAVCREMQTSQESLIKFAARYGLKRNQRNLIWFSGAA
jgi:hypothetical protein